ncbi:low molecular weight phosphotyrosine protein phosphatase [Cyanobium sp. HWJ4-Hawea]|uniref:low molecular weight protein-tyrosine-phosphatase n=1 Tax=Cyanobium sp. HWJ4-Hawea TaxID=2823713 RepID=UPI0020CD484E|nr:low molecular weight protein-tyrosine-phosphatase [Cyanobium sp. HWJ4-Hawea]MCP9809782.1 low molecular weight phosphotyrosine protein phosphatase [Cyanobium sp. HWJ4-Hawea]
MTASAKPSLLFVCLGNICRSPAAEGVFLHLSENQGTGDRFEVDSAGTGGWHVGKPADGRMRSAAQARGIELPSRARQIEIADLNRFDWILTMDSDNLAHVQAMAKRHGQATAKILPITSFCSGFSVRDVPDPYYGGPEGFEQVLDLLDDACRGLLEHLAS